MTRSLQRLIQYLRKSISPHGDPALTDAQLPERWIVHAIRRRSSYCSGGMDRWSTGQQLDR